uniref:Matrix metalloproteinase (inferred by orthology to a C. elegans protein) n=1 Tax=Strongyloides venezuelensis TaxID=75913 RepID=A0A0K0FR91_STRVS
MLAQQKHIFFLFLLYLLCYDVIAFDLFGLLSGSSGSSKSSSSSRRSDIKPVSDSKAKEYLQSFGYVTPSHMVQGSNGGDFSDVKSVLRSAIKKFQEFAGLKTTGELDENTKIKMAEPRCGMLDVQALSTSEAAYKWHKNKLTYSLLVSTPDMDSSDVRRVLQEAFNAWAEVTPLEFTEVSSNANPDIKVKFARGEHGDSYPFTDGNGGVLAHAMFPETGLLHFDEDENWISMTNGKQIPRGKVDLLSVAIHEIGHALGLSHSKVEDSIMTPFYKEPVDRSGGYVKPKLDRSDISEIQDIYGRRTTPFRGSSGSTSSGSSSGSFGSGGSGSSGSGSRTTTSKSSLWDRLFGDSDDSSSGSRTTTPRSRTTTDSFFGSGFGSGGSSFGGSGGQCPSYIDGFAAVTRSKGFIISGRNVYEVDSSGRNDYSNVKRTYSYTTMFPGGPSSVDAAVTNSRSGLTLLFSSNRVYAYEYSSSSNKFTLESGFPKRMPSDVMFIPSGALIWDDGHQLILSPNGQFAVYDENWNQATMSGMTRNYFGDFPKGVKGGFANSRSSSEMVLFTRDSIYKYNSMSKRYSPSSVPIGSYFSC